ncbi:hypothetical protein EJ357_47610 [Streptomyces cyaneochromogenes]|uniref:Uncharacterized protein n=1 Tax=Streptomyces cyaneochromogenes TaxID=2496836 RepID=A0A3S9LYU1_9ACTN|nr:hypothetical protein [Streptomyces cyaneochromogenes]AZQ32122.1 hypothetical protein EJ357_00320 [Streptomyces cyaneochromogenes]AZQ40101.1 hypothetical protein EJ357_47610 [Streptomyces cyaneochromogenes]
MAVIVGLTVSDWPQGSLRGFWNQHAFLAGSLSSVLFLALGATLVEEWIARRDEARLRLVILVACGALARAPLAQRRVMWFALNGGHLIEDADFRLDPEAANRIRAILARHDLAELKENEVINGVAVPPGTASRISVLAADPEWAQTAYDLLRGCSHGFRVITARWAALLTGTDTSAAILEEIALQSEQLTQVQVRLLPVARGRVTEFQPEEINELGGLWRREFANSIALDEALTQLSGKRGADWVTDGRNLLEATDLEALRAREPMGEGRPMRLYT